MVKVGDRVKCIFMDDPFPVPSGVCGTVIGIDSIGQIHVDWDNGQSLALTKIDTYEIL